MPCVTVCPYLHSASVARAAASMYRYRLEGRYAHLPRWDGRALARANEKKRVRRPKYLLRNYLGTQVLQ